MCLKLLAIRNPSIKIFISVKVSDNVSIVITNGSFVII